MKIIFIAGGSGAGKTSLAHKLMQAFETTDKTSQYLTMDDYLRENTHADTINCFELTRLERELTQLSQGHTTTSPDYVVLEGLFALAFSKMLPDTFEKLTVFMSAKMSETNQTPNEVRQLGPAFFNTIHSSKSGVDIDILNDKHVNPNAPHPLDKAVDDIFSSLDLAPIHDSESARVQNNA